MLIELKLCTLCLFVATALLWLFALHFFFFAGFLYVLVPNFFFFKAQPFLQTALVHFFLVTGQFILVTYIARLLIASSECSNRIQMACKFYSQHAPTLLCTNLETLGAVNHALLCLHHCTRSVGSSWSYHLPLQSV